MKEINDRFSSLADNQPALSEIVAPTSGHILKNGKPKDRDASVKFSLALNSTKYIPATEPPSATSPTNARSAGPKTTFSSVQYQEDSPLPSNEIDEYPRNTRQLVANGRVLYEVTVISSSIVEYKASRIAANSHHSKHYHHSSRSSNGSHDIGSSVSSSTADVLNVQIGMNQYDLRYIYAVMTLSAIMLIVLMLYWRQQVYFTCKSFILFTSLLHTGNQHRGSYHCVYSPRTILHIDFARYCN